MSCYEVSRILCTLVCIGSFLSLAFLTFEKYEEGIKIFTPQIVPHPEGLVLPAVTFCNHSGFKNPEVVNTNLTEFLANTVTYDEMFYREPSDITFADDGSTPIAGSFTMKSVYSAYKGLCFTYIPSDNVCSKHKTCKKLNFVTKGLSSEALYSEHA